MWEAGAELSLHFHYKISHSPHDSQHCQQYLYRPRWHLALHRLKSPAIKVVLWYLPEAERQQRWVGGQGGPGQGEEGIKMNILIRGAGNTRCLVFCPINSTSPSMGIQSIVLGVPWVLGQTLRHYCHVEATWSRCYCQPSSGHLPWEAKLTLPEVGRMSPPHFLTGLLMKI